MQLKRALANTFVVVASVCISFGAAEVAARLFLRSADYLSVQMVRDPVLGAVPATVSRTGFDEWGFRNRSVPKSAEIVAIGDSHTYGNTARMEDSWPYVLQELSGRSVYNMGMGGYGPNQYRHLLEKALRLNPKLVLCGLYMGDDFENAYLITYGLEYWSRLRRESARHVSFDIWGTTANELPWHKNVRNWLSGHSVIYQLLFHGPLVGLFQGEIQIRNATRSNPAATVLSVPAKNILEAFIPGSLLKNLDQDSDSVREGMRVTFALLDEMNALCARQGARFAVVIIPTKELVFSDYLEHDPALPNSAKLIKLLANERLARARVVEHLNSTSIPVVDTLSALKRASANGLYARSAADMHPGRSGYRVIAETVASSLDLKETKQSLRVH